MASTSLLRRMTKKRHLSIISIATVRVGASHPDEEDISEGSAIVDWLNHLASTINTIHSDKGDSVAPHHPPVLRGSHDLYATTSSSSSTTTTTMFLQLSAILSIFSSLDDQHRKLATDTPWLPENSSVDTTAATSATLLTTRIKVETLLLVGTMVGLFALAMLCLACFMSGKDVWDKCCCGCCCCCCRKKQSHPPHLQEPTTAAAEAPTYDSVQEFVFYCENDTATAMVGDVPTTMEQLFPDLLASSTDDLEAMGLANNGRRYSSRRGGGTSQEDGGSSTQLREPLL
jgi:hypothetical protein